MNEDIIWHTILSDISEKGVLLDWKYLVKTKIIKAIKERILLSAIPESETIQAVISFLTPGYFTTKEEVKYHLDNAKQYETTDRMRYLIGDIKSGSMF